MALSDAERRKIEERLIQPTDNRVRETDGPQPPQDQEPVYEEDVE